MPVVHVSMSDVLSPQTIDPYIVYVDTHCKEGTMHPLQLMIEYTINTYTIVLYQGTHQNFPYYRIERMFGGGKLWRIWRITSNSPNFTPQILMPYSQTLT